LHLRLHFEWIPGHHDIPGNEKADHLAKAATKPNPRNTNPPMPTSLLMAKQYLKAQGTASKLRRGSISILFQLRTGHIGLLAYLAASPNCSLCEVPETVEHFLFECRRYCRERRA
ncbi:uncharacterized protein EI90DRAFT_2843295, partial [Cantharellus anzutake]|uniref:uncharacterized protein n=1 Tax=Cantharellus anzutake TaxID=1750568 RepID=UPI0019066FB7